MRARIAIEIALALIAASPALAAEPSGCDKFKWPIDHARAALTAPERTQLASGATVATWPATALVVALGPPAEAALPAKPARAPKDGTFAGFVRIAPPPTAGFYTISLSQGGWIDIVQDDESLKPIAFSGATDCDGIRKTLKFDLAARPLLLQVSGVADKSIAVAIQPSD